MAECTSDFLTFIPSESRSSAAQEAIRVHVLRNRHRQRRETHRIRGGNGGGKEHSNKARSPTASGFAQYGGQFQIWQPDVLSKSRYVASPPEVVGSIGLEYIGTTGSSTSSMDDAALTYPIQDEGIECISPLNPAGLGETVSNATSETGSPSSDREAIEETLIQHYIASGGSPIAHDFLRAFRQSSATFSAFLAMVSARVWDEQGGNAAPLLDPTELESQALQGVAREISAHSQTRPAWSTILTVALLANLRDGRDLACHWRGLVEMVRLHGGVGGLRAHAEFHAFLLWAEGIAPDGCPESLGHLDPAYVAARELGAGSSMNELQEFLARVDAQLVADHVEPKHTSCAPPPAPPCKLTSPVLASLQRPPVKRAGYVCDKWRRARLACLVVFASFSLQQHPACRLQDHPQYRVVEAEVRSRERRYTVFAEELYYVTVLVGNTDQTCALTWLVARRVNALKRLEMRDRNTCYRLLALYLGFRDPHAAEMLGGEWRDLSERLLLVDDGVRTRKEMDPPPDPP
ncbi:hypothetical protein LTR84_001423 [Exophiala bonariae]|uniref:Uncharacterized protein n=1 Tax=Exophiala bonariae TaxID=1690606 RepID=A0AAV9NCH0_9EURO|nr:hypothetical protein LTR84_001423 [Exophiala bonariae]